MSRPAARVLDRERVRQPTRSLGLPRAPGPGAQLRMELLSGVTGGILAVFMWGHMVFVASILLGTRGFDWLAETLETTWIAQPTVAAIIALFVVHAVTALRKVPAQLRERRRFFALAGELQGSRRRWKQKGAATALAPHSASLLWVWQVRTGLLIGVLGSFHLVLMAMDVYTALWGQRVGIEAVTSMARTGAGLVWVYALLLLCVEFHAGVGLYRLAVKWGLGARLTRATLERFERVILVFFLALGAFVLVVLAGWLDPPLAFLLEADVAPGGTADG